MDMFAWANGLPVAIPDRSDATPEKVRLRPELLPLPSALSTTHLRAASGTRSPGSGAVWIEHVVLTAHRPAFRALGLLLLAYAVSRQEEPFRLMLSETGGALEQLVLWPSRASEIEVSLGFRQRVGEVVYRPRLPRDTSTHWGLEQLQNGCPREHLPYCRPGSRDREGSGLLRPDEPISVHVHGTAPSLVWLGKFLLDFALTDCHATLAHLCNADPGETMAPGSAELRLVIADAFDVPRPWPSRV